MCQRIPNHFDLFFVVEHALFLSHVNCSGLPVCLGTRLCMLIRCLKVCSSRISSSSWQSSLPFCHHHHLLPLPGDFHKRCDLQPRHHLCHTTLIARPSTSADSRMASDGRHGETGGRWASSTPLSLAPNTAEPAAEPSSSLAPIHDRDSAPEADSSRSWQLLSLPPPAPAPMPQARLPPPTSMPPIQATEVVVPDSPESTSRVEVTDSRLPPEVFQLISRRHPSLPRTVQAVEHHVEQQLLSGMVDSDLWELLPPAWQQVGTSRRTQ